MRETAGARPLASGESGNQRISADLLSATGRFFLYACSVAWATCALDFMDF